MNILSALSIAVSPGAVMPFTRLPRDDEPEHVERELVERARNGNRPAQHGLYVRHYERVRSRIGRLLGGCAEVDDVLQDTFVLAFRDLKQLNDDARFGNWICGIAVHQAHRRLRRRKLLQRLGLDRQADELILAQTVDPSASPEVQMLLKQLDLALATLPPRQRVAWILRYVEGCSLDEVASQCQTSLATVKRDLARADTHLHTQLDASNALDDPQP